MRVVVFDMDGVIIDSEPVHREVERQFFSEHAIPVTPDEHMGYLGMTSRGTFQSVASRHPEEWKASGLTVEGAVEVEQQRYWEALTAGRVPFVPGASELIRRLGGDGLLVAVASSAPRRQIHHVLERGELIEYVTCVRGAEDVTRGKPDPEIYLCAAACLGVKPAECCVVEDSPNGTRAAIAAGMRCIAFTGTHQEELARHHQFQSVTGQTVCADTMEGVGAILTGLSR